MKPAPIDTAAARARADGAIAAHEDSAHVDAVAHLVHELADALDHTREARHRISEAACEFLDRAQRAEAALPAGDELAALRYAVGEAPMNEDARERAHDAIERLATASAGRLLAGETWTDHRVEALNLRLAMEAVQRTCVDFSRDDDAVLAEVLRIADAALGSPDAWRGERQGVCAEHGAVEVRRLEGADRCQVCGEEVPRGA